MQVIMIGLMLAVYVVLFLGGIVLCTTLASWINEKENIVDVWIYKRL